MKKINLVLTIMMISLIVSSCSKEDASSYPVMIRMTGSSTQYNGVFIDLQGIEITGIDGKSELMCVNKGIYNLLDLPNGLDTLIGLGSLNIANLEQIRLILGSQNSIVVNNVSFPLITPSAQESGLKLQVHHLLKPDLFTMILLDFDANQSIVVIGNGNYILKPIIRTVEIAMDKAESIDDYEVVYINQLKFPKHPENKNRELANIWH